MNLSTRPLLLLAIAFVAAGLTFLVVWYGSERTSRNLSLATGTEGGTYAAFGRVMAEALATDAFRIAPQPSAGAAENAQRIASGAADAGFIQGDIAVGPEVAIAARLFPEAFHLVARTDAGIASVSDLAGKRIALPPEGAGSNALFARLLAHYEVPFASIEPVRGSLEEGAARLADGEVDALFIVIALGNAGIRDLVIDAPVQLVGIDQAEAIALFDPSLRATRVPVGVYSGNRPVPAEPIHVVVVDSLLAVSRSLSDATVEALTRAMFENRQAMVRAIPQAAFVSAPTEQDRLVFGVHPGAELYYHQDDPLFVVEYAEPLAFGVTALALLLSGAWQLRIWLAGARKNRADHYNLELVALLGRIETARSHEDFAEIRTTLFEIFERVIVDLDNDRIEERSLTSFSFAWQVAASALNNRQLLMAGRPEPAREPTPATPALDGEDDLATTLFRAQTERPG